MRPQIYANSVQMKMMAKVIEDHCREHGIAPNTLKRGNIARVVISLFEHGAESAEELMAILAITRTLSLQPGSNQPI